MLSNSGSYLIGRIHQNNVKTFFHGNLFTHINTGITRTWFNSKNCICRKSNHFIQRTVFNCQKTGHNFSCTGWIQFFMNIFFIQNSASVCFHQNGTLGSYNWTIRPVFNFVRLNRKGFA